MKKPTFRPVSPVIVRGLFLLGAASCLMACSRGKEIPLPVQEQPAERVASIASLDLQRAGQVRVDLHSLRTSEHAGSERVVLVLSRPDAPVEDTEIRGFLDGKAKYPFNQGTAYHMRVGRRIDGTFEGELELKRSLLRWELPELPPGLNIEAVRLGVWVEAFSIDSPIYEDASRLPLHLYAYPLPSDWGPGQGGVEGNSFSEAAPGESSWNEARAGSLPWPAPGALFPDAEPLASALIEGDERMVMLEGPGLRRFAQSCLLEGRSFDVLLKLDDSEEDRWGTEVALITSEFGEDRDLHSRRPRLELELSVPAADLSLESSFVLETGQEKVLPRATHPHRPVVIHATLSPGREGAIPPDLWVRGGRTGESGETAWVPLRGPLLKDWDWSQVKISAAPGRMTLGEDLTLRLKETWVSPGPREEQLPELVLVAPSGEVLRVLGRPSDEVHYEIDFVPDEPGLWRYGWSFIPREKSPPGSHQGEGLFFVELPRGPDSLATLGEWARALGLSLEGRPTSKGPEQYRLNAAVRWAMRLLDNGEAERDEIEPILRELRGDLPPRFRPERPPRK